MRDSFYILHGKRFCDLVAGITGFLFLSPLFLIIALSIKFADTGPVFFRQKRMGRNFQPFSLLKFRSMVVNAEKMGSIVTTSGDPRITPLGRFLRKSKLDELPQLLNVIKGDMSIVGPRPEVVHYVDLFKEDYREILTVRPGITDYAAIEFRNEETLLKKYAKPGEGYVREVLPMKIQLYKKYIRKQGFLTDLYLIFFTLWKIVRHA